MLANEQNVYIVNQAEIMIVYSNHLVVSAMIRGSCDRDQQYISNTYNKLGHRGGHMVLINYRNDQISNMTFRYLCLI